MMNRKNFLGLLAAVALSCLTASAQQERYIKVNVSPDRGDWVYQPGEKVTFEVSVTKNDALLQNVEISYEVGADMMPPAKREKLTLKNGTAVIDGGTMKEAGFLRCRVSAKYLDRNYDGTATAGFSPENIRPVTTLPADFVQFWDKGKEELSKIPLNARVTLLPERCTDKVNVYHINVQNYGNARLYGMLCIPKAQGKYPAVLKVPGAGARPYAGDIINSERGVITLEIGIHGVPVNMDASVYADMSRHAISGYWQYNLDDKDRYYYKKVYLGCVRAVDFIFSLPEFDGSNIIVSGGSQGGALAIVTAALDSRIKGLSSFYPALCDITGYLKGRAGGWPHMFNAANSDFNNTPQKIATIGYYDVVNFARQVKVPGFYSWGYNDTTCPPTTTFAAYNVITAPKTLLLAEETAHWHYPEQTEASWQWIMQQFKPFYLP
ncbi:MAG: acetylxylan esterase [Bacteroidales bacterium]|jgi:cephalosporin-C deacetylase-like acetyl esterase|nr:acetylxylan esterase [Bacteroidales bacterium]